MDDEQNNINLDNPNPISPQWWKNKNYLIIIGVVMVLLIGGIISAFLFTKQPKGENNDIGLLPKTESPDLTIESCARQADLASLNNSAYPSNYGRITSPNWSFQSASKPNYKYIIEEPNFILEGINRSNATRVEIIWDDDNAIKNVSNFKKGDTHWCYLIDEQNNNIAPGPNFYTVKTYFDDERITENEVLVVWDKFVNIEDVKAELSVNWLFEIVQIDTKDIITDEILKDYKPESEYQTKDYLRNGFSFYKSGVIENSGTQFDGYQFLLADRCYEGHGCYTAYFRILYQPSDGRLILLSRYSNEILSQDKFLFTIADNITIDDIQPPKTIQIPGSSFVLEENPWNPNILFSEYKKSYGPLKELFTDSNFGKIYEDTKKSWIIGRIPDGSIKFYIIKKDFVVIEGENKIYGFDNLKLQLQFSDGKQNEEYYSYRDPVGCGLVNGYSVISESELNPSTQLKIAGQTSGGETFYEFKDENSSLLKSLFNGPNVYTYSDQQISYNDFLNLHPLLYWQDPFGRWIQFKNNKFMPAVECGGGYSTSVL
jgi:hypothetical protein